MVITSRRIKLKKANTPLYFQIYETLHKGIKSGLYQEEINFLPSANFVKNITLVVLPSEALDRLEKDHLIKREHGKGSFVLGVNIHNY